MILGVIELIIDFSNLLTSKEIKFCGIIVELIFARFIFADSMYKENFVGFIFAGGKFTRFL